MHAPGRKRKHKKERKKGNPFGFPYHKQHDRYKLRLPVRSALPPAAHILRIMQTGPPRGRPHGITG